MKGERSVPFDVPIHRLIAAHLAWGALSLGCAGSAAPASQDQVRPETAAIEQKRDVQQTQSDECDIGRYMERAQRLRGLRAISAVHCRLLARPVLAAEAVAVALRDTPQAWLDGQAQFLVLMEFASAQFSMELALRTLIEEELAGFYDPAQDTLYVSQDLEPQLGELALIHELVHALQDQHFDLGRRMREATTSDELSALQILAEGDATSAMIDIPRGGGQVPEAIARGLSDMASFLAQASTSDVEVPALLRRSLLAPYADGLALVENLRASGNWQSVDALWKSLPKGTAALLHTDRARAANPTVQSANDVPPVEQLSTPLPWHGGPATYDDVMGEQSLRLVFEEWASRSVASKAAQGLIQDRLSVFASADGGALIWQLQFADLKEAEDATLALQRGLFKEVPRKSVGAQKTVTLTRGCQGDQGQNPMALTVQGPSVVLAVQSSKVEAPSVGCLHMAEWAKASLQ